ncbi:DUF6841 family protein [Cupriavidus basilensis]
MTNSAPIATADRTAVREMNSWFFDTYLPARVHMGANASLENGAILQYWGAPCTPIGQHDQMPANRRPGHRRCARTRSLCRRSNTPTPWYWIAP